MRALHHPSAGRVLLAFLFVEFFLADLFAVRFVSEDPRRGVGGRAAVALVHAQVLLEFADRIGRLNNNGLKRVLQDDRIVSVGAGDEHRDRTTVGFGQNTAFCSVFRTIGGIRPDIVPPKRALPIAPSMLCQDQSTPPSSAQALTSNPQMRSNTPR